MSEKLLELSSVVNVLSRTVADLEKQRQQNETRIALMQALVQSVVGALTREQRTDVARNFETASSVLLAHATPASKPALKKEIADAQNLLRQLF